MGTDSQTPPSVWLGEAGEPGDRLPMDGGAGFCSPEERSTMWLVTITVTFAALAALAVAARRWGTARRDDHGWMSEQWLAEQRAGNHAA